MDHPFILSVSNLSLPAIPAQPVLLKAVGAPNSPGLLIKGMVTVFQPSVTASVMPGANE